MRIVEDEIDHIHYLDLILAPEDIRKIVKNEMICGSLNVKRRHFYIGIRLQGEWDDEEDEKTSES